MAEKGTKVFSKYARVLASIVVLLVVATVSLATFLKTDLLNKGIRMLHKRLYMGGMASPDLHITDHIYQHAAVATDNKICSGIGRDMLMENGTAVDAAIAAMLCLGVMNAHSTGIGGGGFMMVYEAKKKQGSVIDFRETAPGKAHKDLFGGDPTKGIRGGLSVAVPGELRGMQLAHQKYGRLQWRELFQPAIKLANDGFEVTESLSIAINKWKDDVLNSTCLREIYSRHGQILKKGDKIKNKPLAKTLKIIADHGNADPFYRGKLAKQFVKEVRKEGGVMTLADMQGYAAIERDPVVSRVGEFTMLNTPPPASGPVLAYILNILKGYNMTGKDLKNDPALVYHRFVEAFNFAYAKRTLLADPDHEPGIQKIVNQLMNETIAEKTRKKITDKQTHNPSYYGGKYSLPITTGTTHLVVVGPDGDAAAVTSTVNGYLGAKFRSCKMGLIFNNEMDDFSTPGLSNEFGLPPSKANFIKPYKRPLSSSAPVIVLDKHMNVRLVAGGSGGSIITTAVAQVIMNNLWFGMSPKDSIQQPRIHSQLIPHNVFAETRMPKATVVSLQARGHNVTVTDGSHAVVQGIARVDDQWKTVCKKGNIENADYSRYCEHKQTNPAFLAESDYRKGGQPAGF